MMICSIESLPNELLLEVICHLNGEMQSAYRPPSEEKERHRNLLALLRCSNRFRGLTEPILYSRYQQDVGNPRAFPRFLRTILARPDLAHYVKNFIGCMGEKLANYRMDVICFEDYLRVEGVLRRVTCSKSSVDSWDSGVTLGKVNVLVPLLLFLLGSLECIEIVLLVDGSESAVCFRHMRDMVNRARELQQAEIRCDELPLSKVRKMCLHTRGQIPTQNIALPCQLVWPLLSLHSLRLFSCSSIEGWPTLADSPELLDGVTSNITSLSFRSSSIPCDGLQVLGCLFPKLKALRYEPVCLRRPDPRVIFNPREFGNAIVHLSKNLESLCVQREVRPWPHRAGAHEPHYDPIGGLASFTNLITLEGSANFLIGEGTVVGYDQRLTDNFIRNVPPFLERLTIVDCQKSIFALLPALLKGNIPPTLRSITISFDKWTMEMNGVAAFQQQTCRERRSLEQSASKLGVKLKWNSGDSVSWPSQLGQVTHSTG